MFKKLGRIVSAPVRAVRAVGRKVVQVAVVHAVNSLIPKQEVTVGVKNWKTSLSGIAAIVAVVAKVVNGSGIGAEDIAIVTGAIGLMFSKDRDVTGVGQSATRVDPQA
jgi:hypothetical protein